MIFTGHLVHERSDNSCKGWQYGRIAWSSRCQQHMELALRRWSGSEPILDVFGRWTSNMLYHFCHISKPLKQICTSTIPNMVTVICMIPSKNNPKKWCIPKFVRQKTSWVFPAMAPTEVATSSVFATRTATARSARPGNDNCASRWMERPGWSSDDDLVVERGPDVCFGLGIGRISVGYSMCFMNISDICGVISYVWFMI